MSFAYVDYDDDRGSSENFITLTWPASSQDGDIGFALIGRGTSQLNPSNEPPGWTELSGRINRSSPGPEYISVFWRVKQSGDAAASWSWSGTNRTHGHLAVFRDGFDPSDPIYDSSSTEYTTTNTTVRATSVDAQADSPLIILPITYDSSLNNIQTAPAGWTLHDESASTTSDMCLRPGSRIAASAGATGNIDLTSRLSRDDKHAFLISLRTPTGSGVDGRRFFLGRPF